MPGPVTAGAVMPRGRWSRATTFLPLTIASAIGALTAGRYADRVSPRLLTAVALVLLGLSAAIVQFISDPFTAALYGAVLGVAGSPIRTIEATALAVATMFVKAPQRARLSTSTRPFSSASSLHAHGPGGCPGTKPGDRAPT